MAYQQGTDEVKRVAQSVKPLNAENGEQETQGVEAQNEGLEYSARGRGGASKSAPVFNNAPDAQSELDESYYGEDIDRDLDALPPDDDEDAPESHEPEEAGASDATADDEEYGVQAGEPYGEAPHKRARGKAAGAKRRSGEKRSRSAAHKPAREKKRGGRGAVAALLVSLTVIALVVVLALDITGRSGLITGPLGSVLSPLQSAVSAVTDAVGKKLDAFNYNEQMERELNAALQELATVDIKTSRYDEVVAENERLRALMNNYEKYSQYSPMFARVTGKDTGNWFANFTVDKGTSNGVTEGMTVMSADGVVGRVVEVGLNYSKVMAIIDGSSGVAALIERNRDNGVVRGMVDDTTGEDLLQMNYLPDVNDVRTGDTVLTSGLDGIFPKGLPIGTVTQISRQSSGLSQYVVVTPYADFEHIEEVILLKPQN